MFCEGHDESQVLFFKSEKTYWSVAQLNSMEQNKVNEIQ